MLDVARRVVTSAQARARRRGLPLESVTVGSHDVLMAVKARRGNERAHFAWCLGGDAYRDLRLGKWRESDAFQRACAQVVVPREGGLDGLEQVGIGPNARVLQIEEVSEAISSTVIRTMLAERAAFIAAPTPTAPGTAATSTPSCCIDALAPGVRAYIAKHGLYGTAPGVRADVTSVTIDVSYATRERRGTRRAAARVYLGARGKLHDATTFAISDPEARRATWRVDAGALLGSVWRRRLRRTREMSSAR